MGDDTADTGLTGDDGPRTTRGPRHAAPRKSLLAKFQRPAGKAMALAAMPTAVLVGMGFAPKLALAEDKDVPFAPGPCVTRSEEPAGSPGPSGTPSPPGAGGTPSAARSPEPVPSASRSPDGGTGPADRAVRTGPQPARSPSAGAAPGPRPSGEPSRKPSPKPSSTLSPKPDVHGPTLPGKPSPTPPGERPGQRPNLLDPLGLGKAIGDLLGLRASPVQRERAPARTPARDGEGDGDGSPERTPVAEPSAASPARPVRDPVHASAAGAAEATGAAGPARRSGAPSAIGSPSAPAREDRAAEAPGEPRAQQLKDPEDPEGRDPEGNAARDGTPRGEGAAAGEAKDPGPAGDPVRDPAADPARDRLRKVVEDAAARAGAPVEELDDTAGGLDPVKDEDIPEGAKPPFPCPTPDPAALAAATEEQGLPLLPDDPWVLESSRLTLEGLRYHGIVEVRTGGGKVKKALKFTATRIAIGDLHQKARGPGGTTLHAQAKKRSVSHLREGTVTMYTEKLTGTIFGLWPVTFSPRTPPPLNVPFVWFDDATVVQAGQFGGTLTIPGLRNFTTGSLDNRA